MSTSQPESTRTTDERRGDANSTAILSHISEIAPPADLIGFAAAARRAGKPAFYWGKPSQQFSIAATGHAWKATASGSERFRSMATAVKRLRDRVRVESTSDWIGSPILLGGFSFADEIAASEVWRGFEPARVILPEICIVRRGHRAALIRNVEIGPDTDTAALAAELAAAQLPRWSEHAPASAPAQVVQRDSTPTADSWTTAVGNTVDAIRRGDFDKLVLARCCRVRGTADFELATVLRNLAAQEIGCTIFSVSGDGADFVGATPETLASLDGGVVQTFALAGTTPRGNTADRDRLLREALATSGKDRREHEIVVRGIRDDLGSLVHSLEVADHPEVVPFNRVQHLRTALRGRVAPHCRILDIVAALHPSPAVGGYPKDVAMAEIRDREELERGWYAGPLGWTTLDGDGEFAVALRAGVVRSRDAWLFAGAGIVGNSDPRAELLETELKLRPMLAALAGGAGST